MLCFRCGTHVPKHSTTCTNCNTDLGSLARATRIPKRTLTAMKAVPVLRPDSTNVGDLPFRLGETLQNRYLLQGPLGNGPFGVVFKARDTLRNQPVALKLLRSDLFATSKTQDHFHTALTQARKVVLPSIVTPTDHGFERGCAFVASPILAGLNLQRIHSFHNSNPLDPNALSNLAQRLLASLIALHTHQGHSNLKPTNIILDSDQLFITDHYIHRALSPYHTQTIRSVTSSLHPSTFSSDPTSTRSDLYATAFILHTLLTGSPPSPSSAPPSSTHPIHWTLHRALNTNPRKSFRSFNSFAQSVADALQFTIPTLHQPTHAGEDSEQPEAQKGVGPYSAIQTQRTPPQHSGEYIPRPKRVGEKTLRALPTPIAPSSQESIELAEEFVVPPPPKPITEPFAFVAKTSTHTPTDLLPVVHIPPPSRSYNVPLLVLVALSVVLSVVLLYAIFIHPDPTPDPSKDVKVIQNFGKKSH